MEDHRVCLQESLVSRNAVRKATNLGDETLLRSIRARIKGAERERERETVYRFDGRRTWPGRVWSRGYAYNAHVVGELQPSCL